MKININSPDFVKFIENIAETILTKFDVTNYYKLTQEKKLQVLYLILKHIKSSIRPKLNLSDSDLMSFMIILRKKNEDYERYEFAGILNDIIKNFETINDISEPPKRKPRKTIKKRLG